LELKNGWQLYPADDSSDLEALDATI